VVVNHDGGRYVEWFKQFEFDSQDDAWFVDSGLEYDGGRTIEISDITVNTNSLAIVGQNQVKEYDWVYYDGGYTNTANFGYLKLDWSGRFPDYVVGPWYVNTVPPLGDDFLYSSDTTNSNTPPHSPWFYFSNRDPGGGEFETDGKLYFKGATVTATNTLSDGDIIKLSGQGGLKISGFDDGIFSVTNTTSTNFTLLYKNGSEIYVYPEYTSTVTFTEVKNTFTNVSHLAGQEVNIFADGGAQPPATVSTNGVLVTSDYHNHVVAGLPYTAKLSPMYIDTVSQAGISYAKTKNPYKVHFRVKDSGRFYYGSSTNALYPVSVRSPSLPVGQPVPFFSGDPATKMIEIAPSTAPEFWVTSPEPLPLELLSITLFTKISEYE